MSAPLPFRVTCLAQALCWACLPGVVWAQADAAESAPPDGASVPTVVVSATRTAASPFDIPAAIDAADGEAVRRLRAQVNLSESLGAVPGLLARDRQNYAQDVQISVRGFGARASFGLRGVRVYVDGVPATFPDGQGQVSNVDLGSAARIEVLRGPSSVLYGNSAGGVIQVFTQDGQGPATLDLGLAAGSDGLQRLNAKLSGATASSSQPGALAYVLSASHFQTDGFREHSAASRNIANLKLGYRLDEDSTLTLVGNSVKLPLAQDPLGLNRAQYEANPRAVDPAALSFNTRKRVDQQQLGLVWARRLDSSNSLQAMVYSGQRSTQQFQSIPVGAQAAPTSPGGVIDLASQYRGLDLRWTLRSSLAGQPFSLVSGWSVDSLDQHRLGYRNYSGTPPDQVLGVQGVLRRDEQDSALAVDPYVQALWRLAPDWTLSAGLRHSSVRIRSQDQYIVAGNGDDSGRARYGATLPVLGLLYAVSPDLHLYATAGKGFETPTLNELAYRNDGGTGLNLALQPATSKNLELGLKARLGAAGELSVATFLTRTQHEIVTATNLGGRSTYQNAGATQRAGLELAWSRTWAQHLRLQTALSTLTASYTDAFASCSGSPCATPVPVAAGNRLPGVARQSLYGALTWAPPQGWQAGVEARYLSRVMVNDANADSAPSYAVLGASLGYVAKLGAWTLTGFGRIDNLADKRYVGSVIVNEGNGRYFEPAPGRSSLVGLSASVPW